MREARPSKRTIAARFGRAADTYDAAASLQAEVAVDLAQQLATLGLKPLTILEFGCGTGALTRHLTHTWPEALLLATDLSSGMATVCRRAGHGTEHIIMDAERPALAEGVCDLVCGSLAAQWFHDAPAALERLQALLAPGGVLALTTLGPASFGEWRAAQEQAGLAPTFLDYPDLGQLRAARFSDVKVITEEARTRVQKHADVAAFLRSLSAIGADAPSGVTRLRQLLRFIQPGLVRTTYEVYSLIWQRK